MPWTSFVCADSNNCLGDQPDNQQNKSHSASLFVNVGNPNRCSHFMSNRCSAAKRVSRNRAPLSLASPSRWCGFWGRGVGTGPPFQPTLAPLVIMVRWGYQCHMLRMSRFHALDPRDRLIPPQDALALVWRTTVIYLLVIPRCRPPAPWRILVTKLIALRDNLSLRRPLLRHVFGAREPNHHQCQLLLLHVSPGMIVRWRF